MKPTSLRGIANKAASDKAHRFRNLFGLLTVGFLLWCWQFVNKRVASAALKHNRIYSRRPEQDRGKTEQFWVDGGTNERRSGEIGVSIRHPGQSA
ncbi:MAG: hypothetical protein ACE5IR_26735 [bacterium]